MAAAGGGLLHRLPGGRAAPARGPPRGGRGSRPGGFAPNAFVRIGTDGRSPLITAQVEMGQGVYTSMPMLLAEELEVDLDQVQARARPARRQALRQSAARFPGRPAASTSVRAFYEPLRKAGATARTMLVAAAAQRWNVDPASCRAENGNVTHRDRPEAGLRRAGRAAAKLPVPEKVDAQGPEGLQADRHAGQAARHPGEGERNREVTASTSGCRA